MSSRSLPDSPCRFSILSCPPFTRGCVIQAAMTGPLIPTPWGWVLPRDGAKITQDSLLSVVLVGSKSCFCHQDNIVTWYRTRLFLNLSFVMSLIVPASRRIFQMGKIKIINVIEEKYLKQNFWEKKKTIWNNLKYLLLRRLIFT